MVKNILLKLLLLLGFGLVLVGCSSLSEENHDIKNKVIDSYPNLRSLVLEADLIVKGRIAGNLPSDLVTSGESKIVYSLFEFKIDEILYSSESESITSEVPQPKIVIFQAGGEYQEINQPPLEPSKLLEKDREYVLFLRVVPQAQESGPKDKLKYGIVGDFSGQFILDKNETANISSIKGKELKYGIADLKVKVNQLVKANKPRKEQKIAKDKLWNSLGQEIREIPSALPEFWEHEISFEKGEIGSPQGLKEAVARVSFKNPRFTFEAEENNKLNPSLTIFYYDIKDKEQIRETVEENAHFSGPIPIYYAETKNYIIVTTPYFTNNGYVLKGKLFLLPLDVALHKFFAQY